MSNLYRGPSIDASYQVSDHLAQQFQRRRFLEIDQSETRIASGGHVVNGSERNQHSLQMTAHRYFLPSFGSFGKAVSEEKIFRNQPIREKNCLWQPYLVMDREEMSNSYRGPPIDASYQVSVHQAKRFQRRRLYRNQPIRNKNCLWQPCLLTDRDEMSNCNR